MSGSLIGSITTLVSGVRRNGILLDSNLLLLHLLSRFDAAHVGRGRIDIFTTDDAELLNDLVAAAPRLYSTPHVLAEVVNLAMSSIPRRQHFHLLQEMAQAIIALDERHKPASEIVEQPIFLRLGLTDAGLATLRLDGVPILSVDAPLIQALSAEGLLVLNPYNLHSI